ANLDLFRSAERPVLFWRTGELQQNRPTDFAKVGRDLEKIGKDLAAVGAEINKVKTETPRAAELRKKEADLKQMDADLKEVQTRIVEGWKFERARDTLALPEAKKVAL